MQTFPAQYIFFLSIWHSSLKINSPGTFLTLPISHSRTDTNKMK